jgi:uncharacterized protein
MNRLIFILFIIGITAVPVLAGRWDYLEGRRAIIRGDTETAFKILNPLADNGDAKAQYLLGRVYELGMGVPKNKDKAIEWYSFASVNGDNDAQYSLGMIYKSANDKKAAKYFRKSAENRHFMAQFELGKLYAEGKGVIKDYAQAHMWFNISVAEGYENIRSAMDALEKKMTPAQITEAQKLARKWMEKNKGG